MKFYGEKSFSSFMYKALKVLWWLILLSVIILFFDFIGKTNYVSNISSGMFSIELPEGVLNTHKSKFMMFLYIPIVMIATRVSIKLFDNFSKNIIFDKKNLKFLKYIAYVELVGGVGTDIMEYFDYKLAVTNIHIPNVDINYSVLTNTIDALFVAATYLMIAIALEKAIEYKEENELTV